MNLPISRLPRTTPWTVHLAPALCYVSALWLAAREAFALSPAGWFAPAVALPLYALGLGLAGLIWLNAGLRAKGWVHVLASIALAMPRNYDLPTDLFGTLPALGLSLAVGAYLHVSLWRDRAALRSVGSVLRVVALFAGLVAMRIVLTHALDALHAGFRALGQP